MMEIEKLETKPAGSSCGAIHSINGTIELWKVIEPPQT